MDHFTPCKHTVSQENMKGFDVEYAAIDPKLRSRIEHWQIDIPPTQFRQYGPLTTYFVQRFPHKIAKPQALMYAIYEGPADNAVPVARISIDSTGNIIDKTSNKNYPDLVLCDYYGADCDEVPGDIIRLILEVGSMSQDLRPTTDSKKDLIIAQLHRYMSLLGDDTGSYGRWVGEAFGLAMIGNEFTYVMASELYASTEPWPKNLAWYSIYGKEWNDIMKDVENLPIPPA
ncbi:hypothetical protein EVG20_g9103 [Dentipellis fragilis]|uniref:Uncharacterized protein n=1 Tax=Dentipellis fragilis TaxID=205917 RepID=A0A4Y9Y349_9AGAM|nr:hypothetical protein EVG20_g9103 [Dentipellis fragilis]